MDWAFSSTQREPVTKENGTRDVSMVTGYREGPMELNIWGSGPIMVNTVTVSLDGRMVVII
jgi:hypothetical protein